MPRTISEWIGRTDDTPAPPRVRVRVYERYKGICQLSMRQIQAGEKWELNHSIALIEGGENRESNLEPVLVDPHKKETKRQMAVKKKVSDIKKKHLGITQPKQTIPSKPFPKTRKKSRITKQSLPAKQLFRSADHG